VASFRKAAATSYLMFPTVQSPLNSVAEMRVPLRPGRLVSSLPDDSGDDGYTRIDFGLNAMERLLVAKVVIDSEFLKGVSPTQLARIANTVNEAGGGRAAAYVKDRELWFARLAPRGSP
jgi:hypothetical protein